MPSQPDWSLLSDDLWRHVILCAAGSLLPLALADSPAPARLQARQDHWRIVARAGSSCRALRTALLGPEASQLWSWLHLSTGRAQDSAETRLQTQRELDFLLCRAKYAQSAFITGFGWTNAPAKAAAACLSSVRELTVVLEDSGHAANCVFAALGSPQLPHLSRLCFRGFLPLLSFAELKQLQHLELEVVTLYSLQLRCLAAGLPQLRSCELRFTCKSGSQITGLTQLNLLPADMLRLEMCFHFGLHFADRDNDMLSACLGHLAGMQLHTLVLRLADYCSALTTRQEALLGKCLVKERMVLCIKGPTDGARQLQCLPSGAAVELVPADD